MTVATKAYIAKDVVKLELDMIEPPKLEFLPGQFISLEVEPNTYRAYTICSDYKKGEQIALIVSTEHPGKGVNYVKGLKVGDSCSAIGPAGNFVLPENLAENLVFVNTGCGVTSALAMIYQLRNLGYNGHIELYFGVRHEDKVFEIEMLEQLKKDLGNFDYYVCISQPTKKTKWPQNYKKGRVTTHIKPQQNTQYFICGSNAMVTEIRNNLEGRGVAKENVFYEGF